jgi:hypothetical protein
LANPQGHCKFPRIERHAHIAKLDQEHQRVDNQYLRPKTARPSRPLSRLKRLHQPNKQSNTQATARLASRRQPEANHSPPEQNRNRQSRNAQTQNPKHPVGDRSYILRNPTGSVSAARSQLSETLSNKGNFFSPLARLQEAQRFLVRRLGVALLANQKRCYGVRPVCGLQVLVSASASGTCSPAIGGRQRAGWLAFAGWWCVPVCPTNGRREGWRRFRVPWRRREGRGEVCSVGLAWRRPFL